MTEKGVLLEKLNAFVLDQPGAPLPFSRRLKRENGWDTTFALRAIAEYRKFLLLTQVSGGRPVSPSKVIDHVWHLHLELYEKLLERPLPRCFRRTAPP